MGSSISNSMGYNYTFEKSNRINEWKTISRNTYYCKKKGEYSWNYLLLICKKNIIKCSCLFKKMDALLKIETDYSEISSKNYLFWHPLTKSPVFRLDHGGIILTHQCTNPRIGLELRLLLRGRTSGEGRSPGPTVCKVLSSFFHSRSFLLTLN